MLAALQGVQGSIETSREQKFVFKSDNEKTTPKGETFKTSMTKDVPRFGLMRVLRALNIAQTAWGSSA